jgi:NAD(P)-dependent dehydrogenase (short-subunit alcohol dehydrogenase family)
MKLKGEIVVVLGAAGGLGSAFSKRIVEEGGFVVLSGRNEDNLKALQEKIDPDGINTLVVPADAGKPGQTTIVLQAGVDRWDKKIGAGVICIGNHKASGVDDSPEQALAVMQLLHTSMVIPTFNAIHELQAFFRKQKFGWIANTSSHAEFKDEEQLNGNVAYRLAKAIGDKHLWSLLPILKAYGVRGTNLRPATINTPGNEGFLNTPEKKAAAIQPEQIANWFIANFYAKEVPGDIYFPSGAQW